MASKKANTILMATHANASNTTPICTPSSLLLNSKLHYALTAMYAFTDRHTGTPASAG